MKLYGKRLVPWVLVAFILGLAVWAREAAAAEAEKAGQKIRGGTVVSPPKAFERGGPPAGSERPGIPPGIEAAVVTVLAHEPDVKRTTQGSGFLVTHDGFVVTNWSMMRNASSVEVTNEGGLPYRLEGIAGWDEAADLVVLKIAVEGVPPAPLGDSGRVQPGDRAVAICRSAADTWAALPGVVTSVSVAAGGRGFFHVKGRMYYEHIGGPVVNDAGEVIGVAPFLTDTGVRTRKVTAISQVMPYAKGENLMTLEEAAAGSLLFRAQWHLVQAVAFQCVEGEWGQGALRESRAAASLLWSLLDRQKAPCEGWLMAGHVLGWLGQRESAATAFEKAVWRYPECAQGHYLLGMAWLGHRAPDSYAAELEKAVRLRPDYADAHCALGMAYREQGRLDEAIRALKEATRLKPDHWQGHFNLGRVYHEKRDYGKAAEEYEKAVLLMPGHAESHLRLGYAYGQLHRWKDALACYERAVELDPSEFEAHFSLGSAYSSEGRLEDAAKAYRRAISLKPEEGYPHTMLAWVYRRLGRLEEAIQEYKWAIRLRPQNEYVAFPYLCLGDLYRDQGRWAEAAEAYRQVIRTRVAYPEAPYGLGLAYEHLGQYGKTIEAYKYAIRMRAKYPDAHLNLGAAYARLGRWHDAIAAYNEALRVNPGRWDKPHVGMGGAYRGLRRWRDAVAAYRQAIRIAPGNAEARYGLGISYLGLGDRGAALDEYKILKGLDADLAAKLFKLIYP